MIARLLAKLSGQPARPKIDYRQMVRDREEIAARTVGGSRERPIQVGTSAVIEVRAEATPCPQCEGELRLRTHEAPAPGLRKITLQCRQCCAPRTFWFEILRTDT